MSRGRANPARVAEVKLQVLELLERLGPRRARDLIHELRHTGDRWVQMALAQLEAEGKVAHRSETLIYQLRLPGSEATRPQPYVATVYFLTSRPPT